MNNYYNETLMNNEEGYMENAHMMNQMNCCSMPQMNCCEAPCCPCTCQPIMECPEERVCHKYHNYEVPHIMPCNTKIINHHVYKHTYIPQYTCCEEDVVCNVYDRKCC